MHTKRFVAPTTANAAELDGSPANTAPRLHGIEKSLNSFLACLLCLVVLSCAFGAMIIWMIDARHSWAMALAASGTAAWVFSMSRTSAALRALEEQADKRELD